MRMVCAVIFLAYLCGMASAQSSSHALTPDGVYLTGPVRLLLGRAKATEFSRAASSQGQMGEPSADSTLCSYASPSTSIWAGGTLRSADAGHRQNGSPFDLESDPYLMLRSEYWRTRRSRHRDLLCFTEA
jgi:hypothetical protein